MRDWDKIRDKCLQDLLYEVILDGTMISRDLTEQDVEDWFDRWFNARRSDRPDSTHGVQWGWEMRVMPTPETLK